MAVAVNAMVQALRVVSVERGHDPAGASLLAFGGAGPLHACELATQLGATRVLCLPASGVLSAVGLAAAERRRDVSRSLLQPLAEADGLQKAVAELAAARDGETVRGAADLRYAGQSFELLVPFEDPGELEAAFHAEHERRYGHADHERAIELVTLRAAAVAPGSEVTLTATGDVERSRRTIRWDGEDVEAEVLTGDGLPPGTQVDRPGDRRVPRDDVPRAPGLVRQGRRARDPDAGGHVNAAELQVAVGSLRGIAEEMGTALIHSALSPNIKERRDCSTALFDRDGRLVIQAEHIPVHLGALPASVAAVRERDVASGEVWVLNDPFLGGSHLPDITLVSPIHVDGELLGWAASRAHHADVGGMAAASMPADSTELHQEGLILPPSGSTTT